MPLMRLILVGAVLIFSLNRTGAAPGPAPDYGLLEAQCDDSGSPECCKASVARMKEKGLVPWTAEGCPQGFVKDQLKCVSSLSWCAPAPATRSTGKKRRK